MPRMPPSQSCRNLRFSASGLSNFWRGCHFSASGLSNFWQLFVLAEQTRPMPHMPPRQSCQNLRFSASGISDFWRGRHFSASGLSNFWRLFGGFVVGTFLPMTKRQSLDRLTVNRIKSVGSVSIMQHRAPLYKPPGWDLTVQLLRLGALVLWDRHWS
jgi:hypothetical protein